MVERENRSKTRDIHRATQVILYYNEPSTSVGLGIGSAQWRIGVVEKGLQTLFNIPHSTLIKSETVEVRLEEVENPSYGERKKGDKDWDLSVFLGGKLLYPVDNWDSKESLEGEGGKFPASAQTQDASAQTDVSLGKEPLSDGEEGSCPDQVPDGFASSYSLESSRQRTLSETVPGKIKKTSIRWDSPSPPIPEQRKISENHVSFSLDNGKRPHRETGLGSSSPTDLKRPSIANKKKHYEVDEIEKKRHKDLSGCTESEKKLQALVEEDRLVENSKEIKKQTTFKTKEKDETSYDREADEEIDSENRNKDSGTSRPFSSQPEQMNFQSSEPLQKYTGIKFYDHGTNTEFLTPMDLGSSREREKMEHLPSQHTVGRWSPTASTSSCASEDEIIFPSKNWNIFERNEPLPEAMQNIAVGSRKHVWKLGPPIWSKIFFPPPTLKEKTGLVDEDRTASALMRELSEKGSYLIWKKNLTDIPN